MMMTMMMMMMMLACWFLGLLVCWCVPVPATGFPSDFIGSTALAEVNDHSAGRSSRFFARFQVWSRQLQRDVQTVQTLKIVIFKVVVHRFLKPKNIPKCHTLAVIHQMISTSYPVSSPLNYQHPWPTIILKSNPSRSICLSFSSFRSLMLFYSGKR